MVRLVHVWTRTRPAAHRSAPRLSSLIFASVVIGWWLGLGGIVVMVLPPSAASAPRSAYQPVPGERAHIYDIGSRALPIPVSRLGYDEFQRGTAESDDTLIDAAFEQSEWIEVADSVTVRIIAVDDEAVQIELLDGPYAAHTGWIKARHLGA